MERIFFTMETFSGVSSLILALFLHFSEVPKGEMWDQRKNLRDSHLTHKFSTA